MESVLISPANAVFFGIPAVIFSLIIPVIGVGTFAYIIATRLAPLVRANPDLRFNRLGQRGFAMLKFAVGQYRHPRYMMAGVLHITLFAGFCILSLRSITLVLQGVSAGYTLPGFSGGLGQVYTVLKDIAATAVLASAAIAMIRRGIFRPERYGVPARYGKKDHTGEALFVLALIITLVTCDMVYEGSLAAAQLQHGLPVEFMVPGLGTWMATQMLNHSSLASLQSFHLGAFFLHNLVFFFFLCFLPLGKHFHVITSLPNVFFMKLDKGSVKPVRWGVADEQLDDLESFGVKKFEDFTWKHMLDFYSCADCGRCSDQCPANAVGRPLSPRFISIKCRDYAFGHYPLRGQMDKHGQNLIGTILSEAEIWSCTTCGACEAECPLFIEYIDKIVDLRRGMVDEGMVPQSLQKPLSALEKRGNPWGKMEKKRADWAKDKDFAKDCPVKLLDGSNSAESLYFVDSITSFDDRMQKIAQATARLLSAAGVDFGILGPLEKDSGNEVRRFGEEMLFQDLKAQNTENILETGVKTIITADPHALNALKNDYQNLPPVEHISQLVARKVRSGAIGFFPLEDDSKIYAYHDPCYLGRHNGLYDDPRFVLDAIPGMRRVEMKKHRDRSFCCGGGGLMLFYEPEEDQRMGVLRVKMAKKAGANVIVTACPFCLVNVEDAIKVAGLEGKMEAIDFAELVQRQVASIAQ
jgi:Fe-S oxidoreductase